MEKNGPRARRVRVKRKRIYNLPQTPVGRTPSELRHPYIANPLLDRVGRVFGTRPAYSLKRAFVFPTTAE